MMLNVNWPQLRKLYGYLQSKQVVKEDDLVTFQCVSKDPKSGKKLVLQKKVKFKDFLRVFWDLCESPVRIWAIVVTTSAGDEIYKQHSRHLEQIPIGGTPHIIENWNKLDDIQKDVWLKITMAQIEANA